MTLEFNDEEIRVLIGLLDLAVKAGGLQVSESAVHFAKKIQAASETNEVNTDDSL